MATNCQTSSVNRPMFETLAVLLLAVAAPKSVQHLCYQLLHKRANNAQAQLHLELCLAFLI